MCMDVNAETRISPEPCWRGPVLLDYFSIAPYDVSLLMHR